MLKNQSKIYQRSALMILVIIISGLFNICLFTFQVKAAPIQSSKLNQVFFNDDGCLTATLPEPRQAIDRQSAPIPKCCLTQNRNFSAVINTIDNMPTPVFSALTIGPSDYLNHENNPTYYTSRLTYPPPGALALASTIIRE